MLIHHRPDLNHRVHQWFWRENVTEPERRIENLTHGAGVDDTTGVIESLQTRERRTSKTKLRVVIVFENVGVALAGELDERGPARKTHCHTERKLVGRRDVNDLGRPPFGRSTDDDSFAIDRSRNNCAASKTKSAARLIESRIFNPRHFATIYQRQRADYHRLLRSSGNNNLIGLTARTPKIAKISCDGLAQIGIAVARSVLEQMRPFSGKNLCPQTFPNFHGKLVKCRDGGNEGDSGRTCDPEIEFFSGAFIGKVSNPVGESGRRFSKPLDYWPARTQKRFRKRIGDERSGANFRSEVALGMQLVEGKVDSESGNSEIGGKCASRRKARRTIAKVPGDQFVTNLTIKLLMQRFG